MGYLGRRIGLSQGSGNSNPSGADGAVGGGILDLFAAGYFNREGTLSPTSVATATGGTISYYNGKTIHTFTSSGTFETGIRWNSATVEYVVIGGGGAGGEFTFRGAGGGAGGYRTGSIPIGAHPVTTVIQVGAGGAPLGFTAPSSSGNGTASFFGPPITAPGGGMGGSWPNTSGQPGGSGGGGGGGPTVPTGGGTGSGDPFPGTIGATPANGWGHDGGDGAVNIQQGAGGGGAGAPGVPNEIGRAHV